MNQETVKRYFSLPELWETREQLYKRSTEDSSDIEIGIMKLLTLTEQAMRPFWLHGFLAPEGMIAVLAPRYPGGCPEHGYVSADGDGFHADVWSEELTSEGMLEALEQIDKGELIPATAAVEFIMSNPTLMKGFKHWVKERRKQSDTP